MRGLWQTCRGRPERHKQKGPQQCAKQTLPFQMLRKPLQLTEGRMCGNQAEGNIQLSSKRRSGPEKREHFRHHNLKQSARKPDQRVCIEGCLSISQRHRRSNTGTNEKRHQGIADMPGLGVLFFAMRPTIQHSQKQGRALDAYEPSQVFFAWDAAKRFVFVADRWRLYSLHSPLQPL